MFYNCLKSPEASQQPWNKNLMKAPPRVSSYHEYNSSSVHHLHLLSDVEASCWEFSSISSLKDDKTSKYQFRICESSYFDIRYFWNLFQPILLTEICWHNGAGLNVSHKSRNFLLLLVASITLGLFVLVRFNVIGNRVINYFNFLFCPKI